jgi:hypothetical protein
MTRAKTLGSYAHRTATHARWTVIVVDLERGHGVAPLVVRNDRRVRVEADLQGEAEVLVIGDVCCVVDCGEQILDREWPRLRERPPRLPLRRGIRHRIHNSHRVRRLADHAGQFNCHRVVANIGAVPPLAWSRRTTPCQSHEDEREADGPSHFTHRIGVPIRRVEGALARQCHRSGTHREAALSHGKGRAHGPGGDGYVLVSPSRRRTPTHFPEGGSPSLPVVPGRLSCLTKQDVLRTGDPPNLPNFSRAPPGSRAHAGRSPGAGRCVPEMTTVEED